MYLLLCDLILFDFLAEYVIMVSDVTSPPFLDTRLLPAFVIVRVATSVEEKSCQAVGTPAKRSGTKKVK